MQEIGIVKFVQIQRSALKCGDKSNRYYDPGPILVVEALGLTASGVVGITADGTRLVDVHNSAHPQNRNRGDNGISIGLTMNYNIMRNKFGDHVVDGIAGENIIIENRKMITPDAFAKQAVFLDPSTREEFYFILKRAVKPCNEFSQFAARKELSGAPLKEVLQFLDDGRRGYLIVPQNPNRQVTIGAGMRFLLDIE